MRAADRKPFVGKTRRVFRQSQTAREGGLFLRESPHQLPANEHPIPRKYPPPFRQGRVWEVRTAGRCGERTERCQWQRKRGERVAAVKISSVRRKAAQKFWAPQQDHRPLRNSIENPCVGADAYIGPVAPIFKSCVGRRALTPPRWRSGYRTAGWGQPALQCLASLPKGALEDGLPRPV